ncbi:hypothetical protein PENTCL1PPCAC_5984 [Pristionchus entomophagus]|uniref:G protein-coupled receptor n=1 Tax=Pristionchus entomophagus TaxID=358040 RepID=A0AAV5SLM4_9BILA|nr:hypothetical protein PENTCL1PPCAC_5984 [Pristionchus entomophagus]
MGSRPHSHMDHPRFFLLLFSLFYCTYAVPISRHPDKVISLPGAPLLPQFNLFAGYLNGSSNALSVPIFYVYYTRNDSHEAYHGLTEKESIACYGIPALESFMNRIVFQMLVKLN